MGRAPVFRIAELNVAIQGAEILRDWGREYLAPGEEPDFTLNAGPEARAIRQADPRSAWFRCRYLGSARVFYRLLMELGGFALHACAVWAAGGAYLFCAASGTGKSTHAALWLQMLGDQAFILNDDRPLIRKSGEEYWAWGAPWSGSSGLSRNTGAPIRGIAMLSRSDQDRIERLTPGQGFPLLLLQTDPDSRRGNMLRLLPMLEELAYGVPLYRLECTMNPHAAEVAYAAMAGREGL